MGECAMNEQLPIHVLDEIQIRAQAAIDYTIVVARETERLRELFKKTGSDLSEADEKYCAAELRVAKARTALMQFGDRNEDFLEAELASFKLEKERLKTLSPKEARKALTALRKRIGESQVHIEQDNERLKERLDADANWGAISRHRNEAAERYQRATVERKSGFASLTTQLDKFDVQGEEDMRILRAHAPPGFRDPDDLAFGKSKFVRMAMLLIAVVIVADLQGYPLLGMLANFVTAMAEHKGGS